MTVVKNIEALPRIIVQSYLQAARLPLTAAARVTSQQDNEKWPPALAFASFEAGIETVIGSVLRDPTLVDAGRRRQATVAQLRQAVELSTLAEHEQAAAEETAQQRREEIAAQREKTQHKAAQSKNDIERQAERREQQVREKADKKATAAHSLKANQEKAITRQERVATTEALAAESQALDVAQQALRAEDKAEIIDESIEGARAARKSN